MKLATKLLSGAALTLALISNASATVVDWSFTSDSASAAITAAAFSYDTETNLLSDFNVTSTRYALDDRFLPDVNFYYDNYWGITNLSAPISFIYAKNPVSTQFRIYATLDTVTSASVSGMLDRQFAGTWTSTARQTAATAVPEPEAYAMMLAGLGLVGFAARRKQQAA